MAGQTYNLGINIQIRRQDVDNAIQRTQQDLNRLQQSMQQANQQTQTASQGAQRAGKSFSNLNNETQQAANAQQDMTYSASGTKQQMDAAQESTDNWMSAYSRSLDIAVRSVAIWGAATTAIYGTKRAMEDMHQVIRDVNREMVAVRRVMDDVITDFQEMTLAAADLGVEFAESADMVVQSMVDWARQGYEQEEVLRLTEAALLASNVAQMEAAESVELLTSAILQFNKDASEAVEVVDRLNEVANNYAVTAQDLAMSIRESGAAAESAGVTMDELIGITASLSATTAKSGNRIGRTLRTVFSRIMGDAQGAGEAIGQVEVALNEVGIALREDEETYRNLTDVLTDLASQWHNLDDVMQANIARAMGGRRRYSDVISLMENWDMALDATESSMDSLNSAIEEQETYMESLDAQWQQARSEFERLAVTLGDEFAESISVRAANAIQYLIDRLGSFLNGVIELNERIPLWEAAVTAVGLKILSTLVPALIQASLQKGKNIAAAIHYTTTLKTMGGAVDALAFSFAQLKFPLFGVAAVALTRYLTTLGDARQETEELNDAQEELNDLLDRGVALSEIQAERMREIIGEYQEVADIGQDVLDMFQELEDIGMDEDRRDMMDTEIMGFELGVDERHLEEDLDTAEDMLEEFEVSIDEFIEGILEADEVIDEFDWQDFIDAEELDMDAIEDDFEGTQEMVSFLNETLEDYREELGLTIPVISDYVSETTESIRHGMRDARVIRELEERYHSLQNEIASLEGGTVSYIKANQELQEVRNDLVSQFPELLTGAESFESQLSDLVDETNRYEAGSDYLNEAQQDLEKRMNLLSEQTIPQLENRQEELAESIEETLEEYEKATDEYGENSDEAQELVDELERLDHQYGVVNEQLESAYDVKLDIIDALQMVEEGIDSLDTGELISHFEAAQNVLDDIVEDIKELGRELADFDTIMQAREEFIDWRVEVEGLDELEELGLRIDLLEDKEGSLLDIGEELFEFLHILETEEVEYEVLEEMGEGFEDLELEHIDVDVSPADLIRDWQDDFDEMGEDEYEEFVNNLIDETERLLVGIQEELEAAEVKEMFKELRELDEDDLAELDDTELEEYAEMWEYLNYEVDNLHQLLPEVDKGMDSLVDPRREQRMRELTEGMEELYSSADNMREELEEVVGIDKDKFPIAEEIDDARDQFAEFEGALVGLGGELSTLEDVDVDLNKPIEMLNEELTQLEDETETIENVIDIFEEGIEEDLFTFEEETKILQYLEMMEQEVEIREDNIGRIEQEIVNQEALGMVRDEQITRAGEYEAEYMRLEDRLREFTNLLKYEEDLTESTKEQIEDKIDVLEEEKELYEALMEVQDFEVDIEIEDELGVADTIERLDELEGGFERARERIQEMTEEELDTEQLEEVMEILGLSEEDFEEGIQAGEENLERIADNWADAFTDGFTSAIDGMEDGVEDLGDALTAAAGGFAEVMADEELFVATMETLDLTFMDTVSDWDSIVEEPIFQGAQAGLQAAVDLLDEDGSIGRSITTALGAGIGAAFGVPQIGAAIGDFVGQIGEALGGEIEGREEMEEAVDINEQIEENEDALQEFGYQYDAIMADFEDTAGTWQSFWGGEDWDVENLDKAKEDLEEMERLVERLEARVGDFESSLADAITGAFSYQDAYREFRTSVGEAMIDAALDAMIESQVMQEHFQQLSGQIENAIADGYISDEELSNIENTVDAIMREADEVRPLLDQIQEAMGVDVEGRTRQTFQAGATSSITYHNDYIVQAGAFMGNESEAREFAKMLAPYIHKEVERAMGR